MLGGWTLHYTQDGWSMLCWIKVFNPLNVLWWKIKQFGVLVHSFLGQLATNTNSKQGSLLVIRVLGSLLGGVNDRCQNQTPIKELAIAYEMSVETGPRYVASTLKAIQ